MRIKTYYRSLQEIRSVGVDGPVGYLRGKLWDQVPDGRYESVEVYVDTEGKFVDYVHKEDSASFRPIVKE